MFSLSFSPWVLTLCAFFFPFYLSFSQLLSFCLALSTWWERCSKTASPLLIRALASAFHYLTKECTIKTNLSKWHWVMLHWTQSPMGHRRVGQTLCCCALVRSHWLFMASLSSHWSVTYSGRSAYVLHWLLTIFDDISWNGVFQWFSCVCGIWGRNSD